MVLRPAQEYFTYMETSPCTAGEGLQNLGFINARRSGPLSREGSLSCHTCCDTGPRFFRSHPIGPPLVASYDTRGDVEDLFYLPGSSRGDHSSEV
jgi:hypothetical protein